MKTKIDYMQFIENNLIDCDISYRGGKMKVDASELFPEIDDAIVGAYQNYLGGGIAGSIVGAAMFDPGELKNDKQRKVFEELLEACKQFFYQANNGGGDDYMQENHGDYVQVQSRPVSAY